MGILRTSLQTVLLSMINPAFTLFQVKIKRVLAQSSEADKTCFGKGTETLNAIDLRVPIGKFILALIHREMLLIPRGLTISPQADTAEPAAFSPVCTQKAGSHEIPAKVCLISQTKRRGFTTHYIKSAKIPAANSSGSANLPESEQHRCLKSSPLCAKGHESAT